MRMNLIEAAFFNVTEVATQHDFELDFNWMMKNTLASLSGNRNINRKRLKHAKTFSKIGADSVKLATNTMGHSKCVTFKYKRSLTSRQNVRNSQRTSATSNTM